ncbi:MAG TPA: transglycosylase domain-containing protein [Chloroflexota bacterium]|nr:transglycosylase domain-containing protein [Chloroflexota bacterium]
MSSRTLRRRTAYRAINGHRRASTHVLIRVFIVFLVAFTMLTSGASAATIFFYGNNLPSVKSFDKATQFQNSVFYDRFGHELYNLADLSRAGGAERVVEPLQMPGHPTAYYQSRKETWLVGTGPSGRLDHGIPQALQNATIATEDATFWSNPGFDPFSIVRAAYDDLTQGHIVSGASTITQQLVKEYMVGSKETMSRKAEEIVLAAELTQKYPKTKILWYYLNGVSYGNEAQGAEAAAEAYFHENVWQLDPAQCALLAGLPEAPSIYDPVNDRPAAMARMRYVLHLMYIHGYLRTNGKPDKSLIDRYMNEAQHWGAFTPPRQLNHYPFFVAYALSQLEQMPQLKGRIYSGLEVYTSLDPRLQDAAQSIVAQQVAYVAGLNVTDGALVSMSLDPNCYGCILAMVGSADYNAPAGKINMADTPRQPGSSFKPFNYIYAFQHGLGPGTTVLDAPIAIPNGDGTYYEPTDYDHQWHGVVTLRTALQNSLNVPAVKVEQYSASCGTCGPDGLWNIANQAIKQGMTSFRADNQGCCGWSLTLGGMPHGVRLVEETSAYGVFGANGYRVPPSAIVEVKDRTTGKVLWSLNRDAGYGHRQQVMAPWFAYEMTNVLSDNASRCLPQVCEFGLTSPLYLGRPAAAKTGTTNSFTDNWTVGYTPDLVTGVWVGNANYTPMVGTTGITGAAPIWNAFMLKAFQILNLPPKAFVEPANVYSGSLCREPDAYGSPATGVFDIWAGVEPYCSVGSLSGSLPVPQTSSYGAVATAPPPTAAAPAPTAIPPVATSPPAATAPPAAAPTAAVPPSTQTVP